jgi:hypothetical protein
VTAKHASIVALASFTAGAVSFALGSYLWVDRTLGWRG